MKKVETTICIYNTSAGVDVMVGLLNGEERRLSSGCCFVFSSETITISPKRFDSITTIPVKSELGSFSIQIFLGHVTIIEETNPENLTTRVTKEATRNGKVILVEITNAA